MAVEKSTTTKTTTQVVRSAAESRGAVAVPSEPLRVEETETASRNAQDSVPREHHSALTQAESYLSFSSFSYAGLYQQLTSEYGEEFAPEQAQDAVDTIYAQ